MKISQDLFVKILHFARFEDCIQALTVSKDLVDVVSYVLYSAPRMKLGKSWRKLVEKVKDEKVTRSLILHLDLSDRYYVTDEILLAGFAKCKNLKTFRVDNPRRLSNSIAKELLRNNPYIASLSFNRCKRLESNTFIFISQLKYLRNLELDFCHGLDDHTICHILDSCTLIELLSLKYCWRLGHPTISKLAKSAEYLHTLRIDGWENVLMHDFIRMIFLKEHLRDLSANNVKFISN